MEKLIELIWEWQEETHPDGIYLPVVAYRDWIFWSDSDCLSSVMDEIYLVSKKAWFIKWLVDNDKIDFNKLEKIWYEKTVYEYNWQYREIVKYSDYESLLMLLSISDTPIEDLISYLK